MARQIETKTKLLTTSFASVFGAVVPSNTEYILTGLRVANVDGTQAVSCEVKYIPASGDAAWLAPVGLPLAVGAAEPLVVGDYFSLGPGDDLQAKASANNAVTIIASYKTRSTL